MWFLSSSFFFFFFFFFEKKKKRNHFGILTMYFQYPNKKSNIITSSLIYSFSLKYICVKIFCTLIVSFFPYCSWFWNHGSACLTQHFKIKLVFFHFNILSISTTKEKIGWILMMCWNRQWVVGCESPQQAPAKQEQKDQIEGVGVIPAKNPPKVKLVNEKSLRTL